MIYFAYTYLVAPRMSIAFVGLMLSLGVYAYSKMQREKDREYIWHGIFHIIIGLVSGCIVLLK